MSSTSASPETIFMLRISLKNIKPEVWRRVLVPGNYTFKDLHDVIIAVMGWSDMHMHKFTMKHPVTNQEIEIGGVGDLGYGDYLWLPESTKIAHYLMNPNQKAVHEYDFGFPWYHNIVFEKTIPAILNEKYPKCIGGKRVPPPEEDPGSDYSDSEHLSKDFDYTRVNFGKCKLSVVKSPQKSNEDCKDVTLTKTSSEIEVSKNLKNKSTSGTVEPSAKRAKVVRIKSHTTTADELTSDKTVSSSVVGDVPNNPGFIDPGISIMDIKSEVEIDENYENTITSQAVYVPPVETTVPTSVVLTVANSTSSSLKRDASIQNQVKRETEIEENYGMYIASQMMLVSDAEAREELRSVIQNTIDNYKKQKNIF